MILSNTVVVKANKNEAIAIRGMTIGEVRELIDGWMERETEIIEDDKELLNYEDHYVSTGRYAKLFIDYLESQLDNTSILTKAARYSADINARERLVRRVNRANVRLGELAHKED